MKMTAKERLNKHLAENKFHDDGTLPIRDNFDKTRFCIFLDKIMKTEDIIYEKGVRNSCLLPTNVKVINWREIDKKAEKENFKIDSIYVDELPRKKGEQK